MNEPPERQTWLALRQFTQARIGLGRVGDSLPTKAVLEFGLAHAQARDAVHMKMDVAELQRELTAARWQSCVTCSAASNRAHYLSRPDLGRRLSTPSRTALLAQQAHWPLPRRLVVVIADGLSALAVMRHALPTLIALRERLGPDRLTPIVIAEQARVALGDEIGELCAAEQVLVLIGERPGLSSPDSLGAYLTYAPRVGRSDADRNCVSNIRTDGLSYPQAAHRLVHLIEEAARRGLSGVALKDESQEVGRLTSAP